jgi:hypothetical protein
MMTAPDAQNSGRLIVDGTYACSVGVAITI